jgi:hopanoid biosynthesis associated protein HpnK
MANSDLPRKLIVTADDFGLTRGVNAAVVFAHREGIVTAASLMANGQAFESAVALAKANPGLDVGLHLNLTEGRPASDPSDVPSLATSRGFRYNHPLSLAIAIVQSRVRPADLEREIRSQCERVLNSGLRISHVDGHKHVQVIPVVLRLLGTVLPDYGVKAGRRVVESKPGLRPLLFRNYRSCVQVFEQYLQAKMVAAIWRKPPFVSPDYFYGLTQTGFLDFDAFSNIVHNIKSGVSELMCHPGYVDADLDTIPTRLRAQRESELELLTSDEVRDLISRSGVKLINYTELAGDHGSCSTNQVFNRYSRL